MSEIPTEYPPEKKNQQTDIVINNHVGDREESEALCKDDRRLLSKIDFHLLPWICLLYGLALIDR
jgi:hypothetical protein